MFLSALSVVFTLQVIDIGDILSALGSLVDFLDKGPGCIANLGEGIDLSGIKTGKPGIPCRRSVTDCPRLLGKAAEEEEESSSSLLAS